MDGTEGGFVPVSLIKIFENAEISEVASLLFGGMIASALLGLAIRRLPGLVLKTREEDGQEAFIVSAVLGLLALLLGFTFSLALNRYDDRRELVLQEANAIGTAYLRAQLVGEPQRSKVSTILIEYAENQIQIAGPRDARFEQLLERNDRLLLDLWGHSMQVPESTGATPITSLFVSSVNDVIDLDAARRNARAAKVPSAVYAVLMIYFLGTAAILGYSLTGMWSRIAAVMLFLLFSIAMLLIVDIDRPNVGMLREQQKPMVDLLAFMETAGPEFARGPRVGPD